jgi:hypothetical protein
MILIIVGLFTYINYLLPVRECIKKDWIKYFFIQPNFINNHL